MKKTILYTVIIMLLVVVTAGGTYAYIFATISSNNVVATNSSKLEVIYTGGTEISGVLNLVATKEEGKKTTVMIKISEDSVDAKADLYIQVNKIGEDISSEALNWECYRTYNDVETHVASGTFDGIENGDKIYIDTNYRLTTTETYYTVYIWLDGNKIGNEALGESIEGYIGAEAEHITDVQ